VTNRLTPTAILTGIALIVLPFVGLGLKVVSFGWLLFFFLFGPIILFALGYALQVVIAITGFLSARGPVQSTAVRGRATIAAWVTSLAWVAFCVFVQDGGDVDYGSTFQVWLGAYADDGVHAATDGLTLVVAALTGLIWFLAWVWLVVEWSIGLALRKRARLASVG